MIPAAGLLYVAEVSFAGWPRLVLLSFASAFLLIASQRDGRSFHWTRVPAAALLTYAAIVTRSPVFIALAILLLIPRDRTSTTVVLTLFLLGLHLVWWRYLNALQPMRLPDALANAASALSGNVVHVTPVGAVLKGQLIRFSALSPVLLFGPIIVASLIRHRSRSLSQFALSTIAAAIAGLAITIGFSLAGHVHFFSQPWWPLVLITIGTAAALPLGKEEENAPLQWGRWAVSGMLIALAWQSGFSANRDRLRIAFDEAHGKWETVNAPFDQNAYGRDTVYNYTLLARWLRGRHEVSTLDKPWTSVAADVLVVKMPTTFYSPAEKRAIEEFVSRGGLLLAIGDHTNLYGTAFVLNDLLRPYGMEIEATATVPWDGDHYDYVPTWWQTSRYLRNVRRIQFQTAATIRSHSPFVLPVIVGDHVSGEDADYSNERFFGDLHPGSEDRFPPLVVAAERRYGHGRVLLFADSTIFSTFSLMAPGNSELFQSFLEHGTAHRSLWRFALVGLIAIGAIAIAGERRIMFAFSLLPLATVLCLGLGSSEPLERYPGPWVEIDGRHSQLELRADPRGTHGPGFEDYSTFFAWIGRTGSLPRVAGNAFGDVRTPTIVINPDQPFSARHLETIEHYVKQGGRLLVLDDPRYTIRSTASALLERFGITFRIAPIDSSIHDPGPPRLPESLLGLPFTLLESDRRRSPGHTRAIHSGAQMVPVGLSASLIDETGAIIGGQKQVGQGLVVAFLRSAAFSDSVMGDVWGGQEVDPEKRRLYQLEFDLISLLKAKGQS